MPHPPAQPACGPRQVSNPTASLEADLGPSMLGKQSAARPMAGKIIRAGSGRAGVWGTKGLHYRTW